MQLEKHLPLLRKLYSTSPRILRRSGLYDLMRVYDDLEKTIQNLRKSTFKETAGDESALRSINLRKLMLQLSRSKRRLERKIGNTLLLEKETLERRLRTFAKRYPLTFGHSERSEKA